MFVLRCHGDGHVPVRRVAGPVLSRGPGWGVRRPPTRRLPGRVYDVIRARSGTNFVVCLY